MGFNATVVVCLDQLDFIEKDPHFGKELSLAILNCSSRGSGANAPHGVRVVEVHHADHLTPVIVGGNTGVLIKAYIGIDSNESIDDSNVRMLKEMARVLGYRVSKLSKKAPL